MLALIQIYIKGGGWLRFQDGSFIEHYHNSNSSWVSLHGVCITLNLLLVSGLRACPLKIICPPEIDTVLTEMKL